MVWPPSDRECFSNDSPLTNYFWMVKKLLKHTQRDFQICWWYQWSTPVIAQFLRSHEPFIFLNQILRITSLISTISDPKVGPSLTVNSSFYAEGNWGCIWKFVNFNSTLYDVHFYFFHTTLISVLESIFILHFSAKSHFFFSSNSNWSPY
jgi:hypothetical protein